MAVSTSSYFSNSIIGTPQVGSDIDLYATDLTPHFQVGFGFKRGDGNGFRYGHFGAIVAAGAVVATDVSESGQPAKLKAGTNVANLIKSGNSSMNNNAIGSRYIQLTMTATADQFAGGYLTVSSGTGFGFTYRIKGNDATSAVVSGDTILESYDPIVVALDSNSQISIAGIPYANLEGATTGDAVPAGVAMTNNSLGSYGWICTHGIVAALQDITIGTVGKPVKLSSNTTGAVSVVADATASTTQMTFPLLGYLVEAGSSAGYSLVYLTLE